MAQSRTAAPGVVLAVLCAADFLVVVDGLIVAVALPAMQRSLAIPAGSLQWVVTAYVLCFGGFLLLGGRLGDLYGRRRILVAGLLLFAAGALLAGLAWTPVALFLGRAVQGLGAAAMAPTALALLVATFTEPAGRDRALGLWSAASSAGIPAGALLGGLLTSTVGWRWVLLVNVPAALLAAAVTHRVVAETEARATTRRLDVAGAVLVTTGLAAVVAGIASLEHGPSGPRVLAPVAIGLLLLAAFAAVERRTLEPLIPWSAVRAPGRATANLVGVVLPVGLGAVLFLATLHLQRVLGLTPLQTGLAYLACAVPCIAASPLAARLTARLGRRSTTVIGLLLQALGLLLLAGVPADGTVTGVLPGFVLVGLGAPIAFVPTTAAAMGAGTEDSGLASGIFNTTQQLGNAVALAAIAALATVAAQHSSAPAALAAGYRAGFLLAAGIIAAGVLPAIRLQPDRRRDRALAGGRRDPAHRAAAGSADQ